MIKREQVIKAFEAQLNVVTKGISINQYREETAQEIARRSRLSADFENLLSKYKKQFSK